MKAVAEAWQAHISFERTMYSRPNEARDRRDVYSEQNGGYIRRIRIWVRDTGAYAFVCSALPGEWK